MSTVMRILILFMVEELPHSRYMFGRPYSIGRWKSCLLHDTCSEGHTEYGSPVPCQDCHAVFRVNVRVKESCGWSGCSKICLYRSISCSLWTSCLVRGACSEARIEYGGSTMVYGSPVAYRECVRIKEFYGWLVHSKTCSYRVSLHVLPRLMKHALQYY